MMSTLQKQNWTRSENFEHFWSRIKYTKIIYKKINKSTARSPKISANGSNCDTPSNSSITQRYFLFSLNNFHSLHLHSLTRPHFTFNFLYTFFFSSSSAFHFSLLLLFLIYIEKYDVQNLFERIYTLSFIIKERKRKKEMWLHRAS